jgi:hypothetical protein
MGGQDLLHPDKPLRSGKPAHPRNLGVPAHSTLRSYAPSLAGVHTPMTNEVAGWRRHARTGPSPATVCLSDSGSTYCENALCQDNGGAIPGCILLLRVNPQCLVQRASTVCARNGTLRALHPVRGVSWEHMQAESAQSKVSTSAPVSPPRMSRQSLQEIDDLWAFHCASSPLPRRRDGAKPMPVEWKRIEPNHQRGWSSRIEDNRRGATPPTAASRNSLWYKVLSGRCTSVLSHKFA